MLIDATIKNSIRRKYFKGSSKTSIKAYNSRYKFEEADSAYKS